MNYINSSTPQGMFMISENVMRVENALIQEVVTNNRRTGYILISFEVPDENNQIYSDQIRLNVGNHTVILNEAGESLLLTDLVKGMRIDAEFSSAMTRSIPPQSNAYRIIVLNEEPSVNVTTDRVVSVDVNNGFLLTGNPYDMYDQIMFSISDSTIILDQNSNPIPLAAIQPGQLVRVEHANYQTLSIPPQTPAYRVQVL